MTYCPVAALARKARKLESEIADADEAGDTATARALMIELDALRDWCSHQQPRSAAGLRFQLQLINVYSDEMCCTDLAEKDRLALHLRVQRMSESVSSAIS